MPQSETVKRHVALMDDAAARVGMDLQEAAIRGALRVEEIQRAVTRCTGCTQSEACEVWLAGSGTELPEFCANKAMFERVGGRLT
ncbi:MAG: hypothetical protein GY883_12375 [Shimia sp.]|nr:hypothetical protein [Shimia sp.]